VPVTGDVDVALWDLLLHEQYGSEKAPMKTRMTMGTTVQVISSGELWVKPAGLRLRRSWKR
jgi:hypothetical protein